MTRFAGKRKILDFCGILLVILCKRFQKSELFAVIPQRKSYSFPQFVENVVSVNNGLTKPFFDVDKVVTKKLSQTFFPSFAGFPPCV